MALGIPLVHLLPYPQTLNLVPIQEGEMLLPITWISTYRDQQYILIGHKLMQTRTLPDMTVVAKSSLHLAAETWQVLIVLARPHLAYSSNIFILLLPKRLILITVEPWMPRSVGFQ